LKQPFVAPLDLTSTIVPALDEIPAFAAGDRLQVGSRSPIGHYRVPQYLRGQIGVVDSVILPAALDNEEEGFGRNAGSKGHYYRMVFPMAEVWPNYSGNPSDNLRIDVFESWLTKV
jgi:hypothetical protein